MNCFLLAIQFLLFYGISIILNIIGNVNDLGKYALS